MILLEVQPVLPTLALIQGAQEHPMNQEEHLVPVGPAKEDLTRTEGSIDNQGEKVLIPHPSLAQSRRRTMKPTMELS